MTETKKRPANDLKALKAKRPKISEEKLTANKAKSKFADKSNTKFGGKFHGKGKFNKDGKGKPQFKTTTDGKTDWNDVKAKKKELKTQRKKNKTKDLYELSVQSKQLYEKLKCKATPDKHNICTELHNLMKNCYTKLVHSHDIARVVQCLLKYSQAEIRKEISEILLPHIVEMSTSKYAHFCVSRMLKYGTKRIRGEVVAALLKNIVKLTTHVFSNAIVDIAYNQHASPELKAQMRQEFYSDLFRSEKNRKINKLSDAWEGSPELKSAILSKTKVNLQKCANKNTVDNSLVHSVLLDYLGECKEEDCNEMIQTFSNLIAYLPSTKDGAHAAIFAYLRAQTKDRRAILKGLKEYIQKTCNHEFGHLLVITIINCTDDTVMLNKVVLSTLLANIEEIAANEWGRKVLEWIVAPEDTAFFHPQFIKEVNEGLKFSKKESATRRNEIIAAISKPLSEKIMANPVFWLRGGSTALLTCAIMKKVSSTEVNSALAGVICEPNWEVSVIEQDLEVSTEEKVQIPSIKIKKPKKNPLEDETKPKDDIEKCAGIEHSGLHVALKKMIKQTNTNFGPAIVKNLTKETIDQWTPKNRACFVLLTLIENCPEDVVEQLKAVVNKSLIKKQSHPGSKILLKKL